MSPSTSKLTPSTSGSDGTKPLAISPADGRPSIATAMNVNPIRNTNAPIMLDIILMSFIASTIADNTPNTATIIHFSTPGNINATPSTEPRMLPVSYAAQPRIIAPTTSTMAGSSIRVPWKCFLIAWPRLSPEYIVALALASCSTTQAIVANPNVHSN